MALSTSILSLCSGYAGLSLGLGLALPGARTVCHVEIEATAALFLAARFADGSLDPAPIWSDLRTFDGRPWRGVVDLLTAGYPCQPFSVAGRRRGRRDPRHLWPEVARVIAECEPEWVFLENVAGHLSMGFRAVARQLQRLGYDVAAGLFTAEEVGAPHRRQRLFALAHARRFTGRRKANAGGGDSRRKHAPPEGTGDKLAHRTRGGRGERGQSSGRDGLAHGRDDKLEDAARAERDGSLRRDGGRGRRIRETGAGVADADDALADAGCTERRPKPERGRHSAEGRDGARQAASRAGESRQDLADAGRPERERRRLSDAHGLARERASDRTRGSGAGVADAALERSQIGRDGRARETEFTAALRSSLPVFCPGPDDADGWRAFLRVYPQAEPAFCGELNGSAARVDRLRALGNGVVPLVAAYAYRSLRAAFLD